MHFLLLFIVCFIVFYAVLLFVFLFYTELYSIRSIFNCIFYCSFYVVLLFGLKLHQGLIHSINQSIPLKQFPKLIQFQLHFPNLNLISLLVYFHLPMLYHLLRLSSSISVLYSNKPAFNIPGVFQYRLPILNSSIPLTVSLALLFFQFLY